MKNNYIVCILIFTLIYLLYNKDIKEYFTLETCDVQDGEIKLHKCDIHEEKLRILEEKISLEEGPKDKSVLQKLDEMELRLSEINQKLLYLEEEEEEEQEKEQMIKEEERIKHQQNIYSFEIIKEKIIIVLMICLIVGVIIFTIYLIILLFKKYMKQKKLKLNKINLSYDEVLEEIKKDKIKDSFQWNSFFNFLKKNKK